MAEISEAALHTVREYLANIASHSGDINRRLAKQVLDLLPEPAPTFTVGDVYLVPMKVENEVDVRGDVYMETPGSKFCTYIPATELVKCQKVEVPE